MKQYTLPADIQVFGYQVKNFPAGIDEAFKKLMAVLGGAFDRSFYGVAALKNGSMVYYATAEEKMEGDAEKDVFEKLTIEKGEYLVVPIQDWRNKTTTINGVFHEMLQDSRADKTKPSVEWYKNDNDMWCMIKMA